MIKKRPFAAIGLAAALIFTGCDSSPEVNNTRVDQSSKTRDTLVTPIETTVIDDRTQVEFALDVSYSQTGRAETQLERGAGMIALNELTGTERGDYDGAAVRIYSDYDGNVDIGTFAGGPNGIEVPTSVIELSATDLEEGATATLLEPFDSETPMGVVHVRQSDNDEVDVVIRWRISDATYAQSLNGMLGR